MNNTLDIPNSNQGHRLLPHHRLRVYGMAVEMLVLVRDAQVRDVKLRDEALRAAKGACLNIAEGAARVTRADKARAFTVARGRSSRRVQRSRSLRCSTRRERKMLSAFASWRTASSRS